MHFANQGKALQDKRYEFALKHLADANQQQQHCDVANNNNQSRGVSFLPASHNNTNNNNNSSQNTTILKDQNLRHIEETAYLANVIRNTKQSGSNYFGTGNSSALSHRQSSLLESNMSYQAHILQRERHLEAHVRRLQEEEEQLAQMRQEQRRLGLEEARTAARNKLVDSAVRRVDLQCRSRQKIADHVLEKFGAGIDSNSSEEASAVAVAAERAAYKASERRELRELPRQAQIEFNLPRIVDAALNRLERIDAHHERISRRVALEQKVGTGYARKRDAEHQKVHEAKRESKKARSITAALMSFNTHQYSPHSGETHHFVDQTHHHHDDDSDSDEDGTGALLMKKARLPDLDELRKAKELTKKNKLLMRDEEVEKKNLWEEMDRLDKQTRRDAKKARLERKKQSRFGEDDSESD